MFQLSGFRCRGRCCLPPDFWSGQGLTWSGLASAALETHRGASRFVKQTRSIGHKQDEWFARDLVGRGSNGVESLLGSFRSIYGCRTNHSCGVLRPSMPFIRGLR